jgi:hypothetical protein
MKNENIEVFESINSSMFCKEHYTLRVFENKVLRRIFGPKREKETGDLKKTAY